MCCMLPASRLRSISGIQNDLDIRYRTLHCNKCLVVSTHYGREVPQGEVV